MKKLRNSGYPLCILIVAVILSLLIWFLHGVIGLRLSDLDNIVWAVLIFILLFYYVYKTA